MLGIRQRKRVENKTIRQRIKLRNITKTIQSLKWKWPGHVCRTDNDRWTKLTDGLSDRVISRNEKTRKDHPTKR